MKKTWKVLLAILTAGFALSPAYAQAAPAGPGVTAIRYVTVQVKSYDDALAWYTSVLGLKKVEDRNFGPGRRWLVVAPEGSAQLGIVLEVANADRGDRIGKETNWVFESRTAQSSTTLSIARACILSTCPNASPGAPPRPSSKTHTATSTLQKATPPPNRRAGR